MIPRSILLCAVSVGAVLGSASGASALYLDCKVPGMESSVDAGFFLNVDYGAATVAIVARRDLNATPAFPAQVSDTQIQWQQAVPARPGIFQRYSLDRVSGTLTAFQSDDPAFVNSFNCSVVQQLQKPQPKF